MAVRPASWRAARVLDRSRAKPTLRPVVDHADRDKAQLALHFGA